MKNVEDKSGRGRKVLVSEIADKGMKRLSEWWI